MRRFRLPLLGLLVCLPLSIWWVWPVPTAPLDRGRNGLWMSRHGLHGTATVPLETLVQRLRARGITRIYPFMGPPDAFGHPGWRTGRAHHRYRPQVTTDVLRDLNRLAPEIAVLPWTGGVHDELISLNDARQRTAMFQHIERWVMAGAAGVHLNVEPLPDRDAFLRWLVALRAAVPQAQISIAAFPPPWILRAASPVNWPLSDYRRLCAQVDEIVVMAYDTSLPIGRLYEALVARWARQIGAALADGPCTWSMGVPAYEDDEPWHDPHAETLARALRGIHRGFGGKAPPNFTGVALYAAWTVDAEEWGIFDADWRGKDVSGAGPRFLAEQSDR